MIGRRAESLWTSYAGLQGIVLLASFWHLMRIHAKWRRRRSLASPSVTPSVSWSAMIVHRAAEVLQIKRPEMVCFSERTDELCSVPRVKSNGVRRQSALAYLSVTCRGQGKPHDFSYTMLLASCHLFTTSWTGINSYICQ